MVNGFFSSFQTFSLGLEKTIRIVIKNKNYYSIFHFLKKIMSKEKKSRTYDDDEDEFGSGFGCYKVGSEPNMKKVENLKSTMVKDVAYNGEILNKDAQDLRKMLHMGTSVQHHQQNQPLHPPIQTSIQPPPLIETKHPHQPQELSIYPTPDQTQFQGVIVPDGRELKQISQPTKLHIKKHNDKRFELPYTCVYRGSYGQFITGDRSGFKTTIDLIGIKRELIKALVGEKTKLEAERIEELAQNTHIGVLKPIFVSCKNNAWCGFKFDSNVLSKMRMISTPTGSFHCAFYVPRCLIPIQYKQLCNFAVVVDEKFHEKMDQVTKLTKEACEFYHQPTLVDLSDKSGKQMKVLISSDSPVYRMVDSELFFSPQIKKDYVRKEGMVMSARGAERITEDAFKFKKELPIDTTLTFELEPFSIEDMDNAIINNCPEFNEKFNELVVAGKGEEASRLTLSYFYGSTFEVEIEMDLLLELYTPTIPK